MSAQGFVVVAVVGGDREVFGHGRGGGEAEDAGGGVEAGDGGGGGGFEEAGAPDAFAGGPAARGAEPGLTRGGLEASASEGGTVDGPEIRVLRLQEEIDDLRSQDAKAGAEMREGF